MLHLLLTIPYPRIDPVAVQIGPLSIRWYALAYVVGLVFAWWHVRRIATAHPAAGPAGRPTGRPIMEAKDVDDLLFWATLGVVIGGRVGYVLFYNPIVYFDHPDQIFQLWHGGMSFHGGLIGVVLAILYIARSRKLRLLSVLDVAACATPIGLFLGRMANFINDELWGRPTDVPWAMVFPSDPLHLPRHPSQLYEGLLEGICLFAFLWIMRRRTDALSRPGELGGWFCVGYGAARIASEFFRQPDPQLGYLLGPITMGMVLSVPLILIGLFFVRRARKRAALDGAAA